MYPAHEHDPDLRSPDIQIRTKDRRVWIDRFYMTNLEVSLPGRFNQSWNWFSESGGVRGIALQPQNPYQYVTVAIADYSGWSYLWRTPSGQVLYGRGESCPKLREVTELRILPIGTGHGRQKKASNPDSGQRRLEREFQGDDTGKLQLYAEQFRRHPSLLTYLQYALESSNQQVRLKNLRTTRVTAKKLYYPNTGEVTLDHVRDEILKDAVRWAVITPGLTILRVDGKPINKRGKKYGSRTIVWGRAFGQRGTYIESRAPWTHLAIVAVPYLKQHDRSGGPRLDEIFPDEPMPELFQNHFEEDVAWVARLGYVAPWDEVIAFVQPRAFMDPHGWRAIESAGRNA